MLALEQFWFEASMALIPAAAVIAALAFERVRLRRRSADLGIALKAMEEHMRDVAMILRDPDAPDVAKAGLAAFSMVISSPDLSQRLLDRLGSSTSRSADRGAIGGSMRDDLGWLVSNRPDLFEAFRNATVSGMIVATARDYTRSRRLPEKVATLSTDSSRQHAAIRESQNLWEDHRFVLPSISQGVPC